jgi:hypothetical protein
VLKCESFRCVPGILPLCGLAVLAGFSGVSSITGPEIKAPPVEQKIQIMEAIWEDFRDRFDTWDIPEEQRALLGQRRARVPKVRQPSSGYS